MRSLQSIIADSREQGIQAARDEKRPLVIEEEDWLSREVLTDMIRRLPNIGDYTPDGWTETKRFFVDILGEATGKGMFNTPEHIRELKAHGCLTFSELLDNVRVGFGYAIVEGGQFQVYIGEFKKGEK